MVAAVGLALHMAGGSLHLPLADLFMGVAVGGLAYLVVAWSSGRALMAELNRVTGAR
jgi:hypothetical protein